MDIMLVNSIENLWYEAKPSASVGLLLMRGILKERYDVEYVDFGLIEEFKNIRHTKSPAESLKTIARYITDKAPKVVGFYTICHTFFSAVMVAKYVKELNGGIKIVFGGPHATLTAAECVSSLDFLDAVCLGEAELSVAPLMDALINGGDMASVPGVVYRSQGEVKSTPPKELIAAEDLGKYTVFDYSPYKISKNDAITLEGGRGCPFGCTFCSTNSFWGRRFRVKPIDVLLDEMDKFNEIYGVTHFNVLHDLFTTNRQYIKEFCRRLIDGGKDYKWGCSSRIDTLDGELIGLLKESKCAGLFLGIETGSPRMQKILNKNLELDKALETVKRVHDSRIPYTVSFIYGFPDETEADFLDTLKMIEFIFLMGSLRIQLHRYMCFPHTEETEKVKHRLHFGKNEVHIGIFNEYAVDGECVDMIREHPDIFTQYYAFDSEVMSRYTHIDVLTLAVFHIAACFKHTMKHLVSKYGLRELYFKYGHLFRELRHNMDRLRAAEKEGYQDFDIIYEAVNRMVLDEEQEMRDFGFSQLCRYERLMVLYIINKKTEPEIHEFDADIGELKKTGVCVPMKYQVRYSLKNDKVVATRYSPLLKFTGAAALV